jgi:aryl-alcohol dehydrogenase-like predicted oxidoreductase
VNPAEIALRFALDYPGPDSTLIGVSNLEQLASSLRVLEMSADDELLKKIDDAIGDAMDMRWHEGLAENFE